MIKIFINILTEQINGVTISSAGFKASFETKSYTSEKTIGIYYGHCNGYDACEKSIVVACSMIKDEFKDHEICMVFNKKTHLNTILRSKKQTKGELHVLLKDFLAKMRLNFSPTIDQDEKSLQMQDALRSARYSMVKKRNDIPQ